MKILTDEEAAAAVLGLEAALRCNLWSDKMNACHLALSALRREDHLITDASELLDFIKEQSLESEPNFVHDDDESLVKIEEYTRLRIRTSSIEERRSL